LSRFSCLPRLKRFGRIACNIANSRVQLSKSDPKTLCHGSAPMLMLCASIGVCEQGEKPSGADSVDTCSPRSKLRTESITEATKRTQPFKIGSATHLYAARILKTHCEVAALDLG